MSRSGDLLFLVLLLVGLLLGLLDVDLNGHQLPMACTTAWGISDILFRLRLNTSTTLKSLVDSCFTIVIALF